jgi:DNA-binding beta-propeller fold protein YncE
LSADPVHHRLFVAALGNGTVEVVDVAGMRSEQSLPGFAQPQGVLYAPAARRLYVSNAGTGRVDILDAISFRRLRRIEGLEDADNLRYDPFPLARKFYVGYGNGALRALDTDGNSFGEFRLAGHPESFQIERSGRRIFVNVPGARQVAVVVRVQGTVKSWDLAGASSNFPMALDEENRRLFVGTRSPPLVLVYDTRSGNIIARLPIARDVDDIFFDAARKLLYAICGEGEVNVFRQERQDKYASLYSLNTSPGARTGLFVPEEGRLYVAAPARESRSAQILVYRSGR